MARGKTEAPATWETSDISTAAYLKLKGLRFLGVREGTPRRFFFRFDDPEGRAPQLQVEFLNSECRDFDSEVRSLKKLCYADSKKPRRRAP